MIASLPMYDATPSRAANDRLWAAIRDRIRHGPEHLTRGRDPWKDWLNPELLLSQTCGLPYRARLADAVTLVGTPDYGLGAEPGYYYSVIIGRKSGPASIGDCTYRTFACNDALSQSGWAAAVEFAEENGLEFGPVMMTGSHQASAQAVIAGRADFAALDVITWNLYRETWPGSDTLVVLAETNPTPGLPVITARTNDPDTLFDAMHHAIRALSKPDRECLLVRDLVRIPAEAYLSMPLPPQPQGERLGK